MTSAELVAALRKWANLHRGWSHAADDDAAADYIERVEALVHDLALVLSRMVVGWEGRLGVDLAEHPEVRRVMAAYREWKVAS